jgi:2,3-bisphosphoglycerate-independent phosphoglycerate mutase
MKYIILIGDGMGDLPLPQLDGKTVLQAARTPAMDSLCKDATLLRLKTIPDGFPPGSEIANMSLLGYDPARYFTGRAPLEAASMGVDLTPTQTAYRCNLVTMDWTTGAQPTLVDFSAELIATDEAAQLIEALQRECGDERFTFYPGVGYRHLLVVDDTVPAIDTVAPHDHMGKDITTPWQVYQQEPTWAELLHTASAVIADHPVNHRRIRRGLRPANAIWPWGSGKMPAMPTLTERFGITGTMISAVDLLKGLGVLAGLDAPTIPGATGYIDTNYEGKANAALDALSHQDFAYVHLEAPDEAGHQANVEHKIMAVEDFDARIVAPIVKTLTQRGEPFRLVVTMDHFTPIELRTHTDEPVPALLYDSGKPANGSQHGFHEALRHDDDTPLTFLAGHELLPYLVGRPDADSSSS